jgi:choline dehydrogenase-like flavoprotein
MSKPLDCDVVIVGAGIAGALLAWKLGSQGVKVIVLESGPGNQDLNQRGTYIDNFKISGAPYPLRPAALKEEDFFTNSSNYYQQQPAARPAQGPMGTSTDPADPSDPFGEYNIISTDVLTNGDWFQSNYERQAGGATWHWLGTSLRLLPNDFKLKSTYNPAVGNAQAYDWPIGYNDIEPWYGVAEQTIGVSAPPTGEDYLGITRSSNYPMPGIPQSYLDQQFVQNLNGQMFTDPWVKQSYPLTVSPTPQARNSTPGFGGRPQCQGSTSCIPICPIQAKYDATQHVQLAQSFGNVEFRVQSVAYQVVADTTDPQLPIASVLYKTWTADSQGNVTSITPGQVTGKFYVLAAHAVENVKILLNSPMGQGQPTVANQSGQVGRNLADHPVSLVYALTDQPLYGYRGPLSTSGIESLRDGAFRTYRGAFRMEIGNDGWSWPIGDPYTTPANLVNGPNGDGTGGIWGQQLAQSVAGTLVRQTRIGCLAEQLPNPNYGVALSGTLDKLGIPMPRMTYGIDIYGQRSLSAAVAASVQVFKTMIKNPVVQYNYTEFLDANGTLMVDTARSTDQGTPNIFIREGWAGAGHLMGTHRMGTDPGTSVVDGTQKAHGHPNLYLLGSGNWPSYATGNPTLTIAALALWAADTIRKRLTP